MKPLLFIALLLVQPPGGPTYKGQPRKPNPFAPSLPTLTAKEEAALAQIIDKFIEQDIGKLKGAGAAKAVSDFKALGPEATFALLEGLNKAANMEDSCPAVLIGKKLSLIINSSKDVALLDFLRDNIGAGVTAKRHTVTIKDLRLACALRTGAIKRATIAGNKLSGGVAGKQKTPAAMTVPELAGAANKETGELLKNVLIELATRPGDQAVHVLGKAAAKEDKELGSLAPALLMEVLGKQSAADLAAWLKKGSPSVRAAAARVIGAKGYLLTAALIDALNDPEESVRQAARSSLAKLASSAVDYGPQIGAAGAERARAQEQWRAFWLKKS